MSRLACLAASLVIAACGTSAGSQGSPEAESPTPEKPAEPSPCHELEFSGALAVFEGQPCTWTLRASGDEELGGLELVRSTKTPMSRLGETPAPCRTAACTYRGVETPAGPLIVVEVAGAESEVPSSVWLGLEYGERLRFVDLWDEAGDAVLDGGISLGPAHALAPFDCDGTVVLLADARLPGAGAVPPPASLLAREHDLQSTEIQRARCEPLHVGLP